MDIKLFETDIVEAHNEFYTHYINGDITEVENIFKCLKKYQKKALLIEAYYIKNNLFFNFLINLL